MREFRAIRGDRFQRPAETLAHFGGGGLREGDDQQVFQGDAGFAEAGEAALDEGVGFAGARAGHHQYIAPRGHGRLLGGRQLTRRAGWLG